MSSSQRLITVLMTTGAGLLIVQVLSSSSFSGMLGTLGGLLLMFCGVGWWLADKVRRLAQFTAWTGLAVVVVAIISLIQLPWNQSLLLLFSGVAAMLVAGYASVWRMNLPEGMQPPPVNLALAVKVLLDELVMGYFLSSLRFPKGRERMRVMQECRDALALVRERGWIEEPAAAHPDPEAPEEFELRPGHYKRYDYRRLIFDSSFPGLALPGTEQWLSRPQQVRARVFEHADGPRPWLVCVHGYRMGWLPMDFQLFPPGWLHHKLGFNLLMPILPLHGKRRHGWRSGDKLFDGDVLHMLHAITQGVYDLRCLLAWLRQERGAEHIGMLGYSLGDLHVSLVAALESQIDSLLAGIPLVDIPAVMWDHSPRSLVQDFEDQGLGMDQVRELLRPISPLCMPPRVDTQRLGIAAASADRLVPVEPVLQLAAHWEQAQPMWYAGSHLSVRRESVMRDWLLQHWETAGLLQMDLNEAERAG